MWVILKSASQTGKQSFKYVQNPNAEEAQTWLQLIDFRTGMHMHFYRHILQYSNTVSLVFMLMSYQSV